MQEGDQAGLIGRSVDGGTQVRALDTPAHLTLDASGLKVTVSYPLLIAADPVSQTFTYIQHEQQFRSRAAPPRWQPALRLALAAVTEASSPGAGNVQPDRCQPDPHQAAGHQPSEGLMQGTYAGGPDEYILSDLPDDSEGGDRHHARGPPQNIVLEQQQQPCESAAGVASMSWRSQTQAVCHQEQLPGVTAAPAPAYQDPTDPHWQQVQCTVQKSCGSYTELPISGSLEGQGPASLAFAELPWWRSKAAVLSPGSPHVQLEQTAEALYHCLPHCGEVHAWVSLMPLVQLPIRVPPLQNMLGSWREGGRYRTRMVGNMFVLPASVCDGACAGLSMRLVP